MDNPGDVELVDRLLFDEDAPPSVVKVFRLLCRSCERYSGPGTWLRQCTIAKATGLGQSTVRVALHWLEDRGWIARTVEPIGGEDREVTWCLWLLPSGSVDSVEVDFGQGVKARPDGGPIRRPSRPARGAGDRRVGADACAQGSAPENSKRTLFEKDNVNVNAAAPGGEQSKHPEVEPPRPNEPPAPPTRMPAPPEVCLASLASAPIRFPALVAGALWDLVDQGVELPGAWAKVKMPARPEPDPPPSPAPCPAAKPSPPAPAKDTEAMYRRLANPGGQDQARELVQALADQLVRELDDFAYRNAHVKWLTKAVECPGEVPVKALIKAYRGARRSNAEHKGALYKKLLDDGLRIGL